MWEQGDPFEAAIGSGPGTRYKWEEEDRYVSEPKRNELMMNRGSGNGRNYSEV